MASHDNWVLAGPYKGLVIKDCGRGNQVVGDVKRVDRNAVPCN
jgi:hypothetical protein